MSLSSYEVEVMMPDGSRRTVEVEATSAREASSIAMSRAEADWFAEKEGSEPEGSSGGSAETEA